MITTWQDYVQITRKALSAVGEKISKAVTWGYNYCPENLDEELVELSKAAELLRNQELYGAVCICDEEVAKIKSHIHRVVGPECKVTQRDFSRATRADLPRYIADNPYCLAYETTAEYIEAQCARIGINFKVVEKRCADVGINVTVTNPVILCAYELALDIQEKTCDIDINPTVDLQECVIDFVTKVEQHTCDIDLKTYIQEISCGADLGFIVSEHPCEADIDIDLTAATCDTQEVSVAVTPVLQDFTVTTPDTTVCYYTDIEISLSEAQPGVTYTWDFGTGAIPTSEEGSGPFTVYYTSSGAKTITVTATLGDQEEVNTLGVTISSCPGQIGGHVADTLGNNLQNYNMRLYFDTDADGIPDSSVAVKNVFSTALGIFSMASLVPGNYILEANTIDDDVTFEDTGTLDGVVDTLDAATPVVAGNKAVKIIVRPSEIQGLIEVVVDLT